MITPLWLLKKARKLITPASRIAERLGLKSTTYVGRKNLEVVP